MKNLKQNLKILCSPSSVKVLHTQIKTNLLSSKNITGFPIKKHKAYLLKTQASNFRADFSDLALIL